jgi:DnaK suppressor protein
MDMNTKPTRIADELSRLRADLERRMRSLATAPPIDNLDVEFRADPIDQVRSNLDREVTVDQLNRQSRLRKEIHCALDRITAGEYGRCEECEEQIAPQRINAVPWARLCIKCQSRLESRERSRETFRAAV